jgi:hypothetical protein
MADRVAVNRIVVGKDDTLRIIEPGTRFETSEFGIDDEVLKRFEARGVIREPRDENRSPPREESETYQVIENRKPLEEGQPLGATQRVQEQPGGQEGQPEQPEREPGSGRRSGRRMEDL